MLLGCKQQQTLDLSHNCEAELHTSLDPLVSSSGASIVPVVRPVPFPKCASSKYTATQTTHTLHTYIHAYIYMHTLDMVDLFKSRHKRAVWWCTYSFVLGFSSGSAVRSIRGNCALTMSGVRLTSVSSSSLKSNGYASFICLLYLKLHSPMILSFYHFWR